MICHYSGVQNVKQRNDLFSSLELNATNNLMKKKKESASIMVSYELGPNSKINSCQFETNETNENIVSSSENLF